MAFTIHLEREGKRTLIQTIDVMTFDESGKIVDMKAYHGPGDAEVFVLGGDQIVTFTGEPADIEPDRLVETCACAPSTRSSRRQARRR